MQLYAYWLDGEYLNFSFHPTTVIKQIRRTMKLHALFGNTFLFADTQVTDSFALLTLFEDYGFRQYLRENNGAQLKTQPVASGRMATRSGLYRSENQKWTSSVFRDPGLVRTLLDRLPGTAFDPGELITNDSKGSVGELIKQQTNRNERRLLTCLIHALAFFEGRDERTIVTDMTHHNLYDKLKDACESTMLPDSQRRIAQLTLNYIDKTLAPEQRRFRSALFSELKKRGAPPRLARQIHGTAVQAWNAAVAETINAESSSAWHLPHTAFIPLASQQPLDSVLPLRDQRISELIPLNKIGAILPWDPDCLSWEQINEAVKNSTNTCIALQEALHTNISEAHEALEAHLKCIATSVRPDMQIQANFLIALGSLTVSSLFGKEMLLPYSMITPWLQSNLKSLLQNMDRREVVYTLKRHLSD